MAKKEITITIEELEQMLIQQKKNVASKIIGSSGHLNTESTAGINKPLPIDKEKFEKDVLETRFPDEFNILKKYVR